MERLELITTIVERCWSTPAGLELMTTLVAPDYVHHTPFGDGAFDAFRAGLRHVDELFSGRRYRLVHAVDDGHLVAGFLTWSATRLRDGSAVVGSGAYHCRVVDGLVVEDWDAFFPSS